MATVTFPEIFNNGLTLLNGAISDSATSVIVDSAVALGIDDSTTDAYVTIIAPATFGFNPFLTPETLEVIQVTAASGNTLTVTRGVDGTSGVAFGDNAYVMTRNNAATLQRVYDALTDGNDSLNIDALITGGSISAGSDLTFDGDLTNGTTGVNKLFFASIPVSEMVLGAVNPAGAVVNTEFETSRVHIPLMPFSGSGSDQESASFVVGLPDDYDGSALKFVIHWTILTGSGTCLWAINAGIFGDGEDMAVDNSGISSGAETAPTAEFLKVTTETGTPTGASAGDTMMTVLVRRLAQFDTMTADAQLIKIDVSYV